MAGTIVSPSVCAILVFHTLVTNDAQNLTILHSFALDYSTSSAEASKEAFRCIANALLLEESGRDNWITIGGGAAVVSILEVGWSFPLFRSSAH